MMGAQSLEDKSGDKNWVSTPLLVEVFLPTVGAAVQASFELDPLHQADVFTAVEALLERAASFCNGKITHGNAAAQELERLQQTAVQDLDFLGEQFRLVDEWKAKAHEAGLTLAKMREAYMKELTMLRSMLYKKQKVEEGGGEFEAPDVLVFKAEEFLLANEVAKRISDWQLAACKEKMVSMQIENVQNLFLVQSMTKSFGYASERDAREELGDCDVNFEKAEQVISTEMGHFKQEAERRYRLKLKQCEINQENGEQRRKSLPSKSHQFAKRGSLIRRKSDPSSVSKWQSEGAVRAGGGASSSSSSEDEDGDDAMSGLKARYEAKLKGKENLISSKTLQRAKDKFLQSIRKPTLKPKVLATPARAVPAQTSDAEVQTEVADAEPAVAGPTFQEQGVNTITPCLRDRGINPIPADEMLSNAILNDSHMGIHDILSKDGSPKPLRIGDAFTQAATSMGLPRCGPGARQENGSQSGAGRASARRKNSVDSLEDIGFNRQDTASSAASESSPRVQKLKGSAALDLPYVSPFSSERGEVLPPTSPVGSDCRPKPLQLEPLSPVQQDELEQAPLSPQTPITPAVKSKARRKSIPHRGKFSSQTSVQSLG